MKQLFENSQCERVYHEVLALGMTGAEERLSYLRKVKEEFGGRLTSGRSKSHLRMSQIYDQMVLDVDAAELALMELRSEYIPLNNSRWNEV